MKWVVWAALAAAGMGYWWYESRKAQPSRFDWAYGEADARDTAEHVARMYGHE